MKLLSGLLLLFVLVVISSCKKSNVPEALPIKGETGYLLASINKDGFVQELKYNMRNQLIEVKADLAPSYDSFLYDANDRLLSCRCITSNSASKVVNYLSFK